MLNGSYLVLFLDFKSCIPLLFNVVDEAPLILNELLEVSARISVVPPSVDVRSELAPFKFFAGLLFSQGFEFLVLLGKEIFHLRVKV